MTELSFDSDILPTSRIISQWLKGAFEALVPKRSNIYPKSKQTACMEHRWWLVLYVLPKLGVLSSVHSLMRTIARGAPPPTPPKIYKRLGPMLNLKNWHRSFGHPSRGQKVRYLVSIFDPSSLTVALV